MVTKMSKPNSFWRGTLYGVIIGLLGGILLAPKSGRETQDDIKRRAKQMMGDTSRQVDKLQNQLGAKVEKLKEAAKDLSEEAREESLSLIARAQVMKQDLRTSTKSLGQVSKGTKDETLANVRQIMDQGATLMNELEDATKRLMRSAKSKLRESQPEALARIEELEQNGHASDD